MLAEWLSSQDVGFASLDNDHKRIDAITSEVLILLERQDNEVLANRRLRELLFLLDHHFNTERLLMKLSHYHHSDKHHSEHRKILTEFEMILNIGGFSRSCLRNVALFIRDAIKQHRVSADLPLEAFLRSTPEVVRLACCRKAVETAVLDIKVTHDLMSHVP